MTASSSAQVGGIDADAVLASTPRAGDRERDSMYSGSTDLLRLVIRRDRVQVAIWVAAAVALVVVSAVSIEGLYKTQADLDSYGSLVDDNPAVVVQSGPGYGLSDHPSTGAVLMNEVSLWTLVLVSIMSIFLVTRHTRAEEESERAELLRSSVVGRRAAGAATMSGALVANLAVGSLVAVSLVAMGMGTTGSVAFGSALIGTGTAFAAVTLVCAQVASTGRATTGMAIGLLGVSFVVRAIGDVTGNGMTWLSPLGWGQGIRAFAGERWWVLILPFGATVTCTAIASVLSDHRDFGAGMLPQRSGRASGSRWLSSPLGLAGRLQRSSVIGWAVGVLAFGVFYGAVANEIESMVADNPDLAEFFTQAGAGSLTEAFLASAAMMIALVTAGFAISGVLRPNTEESNGRVDSLLAAPVSRISWASSHVLVAMGALVAVLFLGGLGLGLGAAASTGESRFVAEMIGALVAFVPAAGVLAAIAFALWGIRARLAMLGWLGLVYAAVVGLLAELLDLPQWARDLSPFEHVPALPAAGFDVVPLLVLSAVAVVLFVVGFVGLRRRDIA